jgi:hypothetical protein
VSQYLAPARRSELSELAAQAVRDFCPKVPVEPEEIAAANGITMSFGSYGESFDGMLECEAARFHIYCNLDRVEARGASRARFTLGHELGHYFVDAHRNALLAGQAPAHLSLAQYESQNPVEQEADFFSSRLLMPEPHFTSRARAAPRGLPGVLEVARLFDVSRTSAAIRYAQSDALPCAVIKWSPKGFGWKWLSTDTFRARYRATVTDIKQLPADGATARALGAGTSLRDKIFENGTTASAWFKQIASASDRNVILIEQAVSLGRFGALTFLYPESGAF